MNLISITRDKIHILLFLSLRLLALKITLASLRSMVLSLGLIITNIFVTLHY